MILSSRCHVSQHCFLVQVYQDAMMVKALENPNRGEVEDLLEEFGKKW